MSKFKVGDRVKVTSEAWSFSGRAGTVVEIDLPFVGVTIPGCYAPPDYVWYLEESCLTHEPAEDSHGPLGDRERELLGVPLGPKGDCLAMYIRDLEAVVLDQMKEIKALRLLADAATVDPPAMEEPELRTWLVRRTMELEVLATTPAEADGIADDAPADWWMYISEETVPAEL